VSGQEWVALRIDVPPAVAEEVASFLVAEGAPAVVTETGEDGVRVEVHVPAADESRLAGLLARYLAIAPSALTTVALPDVDWSALARRHHRPRPIGERLLVAPPWEIPVAPGREVLIIEPGMAFGTGQHATTRGCLEAIEQTLTAAPAAAALDVGTGSGVLALALARLGVPRVVALDVDPAVLPLARANLDRNGAADVLLVAGNVDAVRGTFDLVVANLLAEPIVAEASALARRVATGGRLILSGLLDAQVATVSRAYAGWRSTGGSSEDGWRTLVLERDPSAIPAARRDGAERD
jgi:ribosomal protein L11 methyltransferase